MTVSVGFTRIFVGCHRTAFRTQTIRQAAELAGLMKLDLHGLFLEDEGLMAAALLPGLREFRMAGRTWQPMEADAVRRSMQREAQLAEKLFSETAQAMRVACRFEIARERIEEAVRLRFGRTDIVLVAEPKTPADRAGEAFRSWFAAASRSASTVLYLPQRPVRSRGPVLALAASPDDPSLAVARAIAAAVGEEFQAESLAVSDPVSALAVLPSHRERMLVISRPVEALGEALGESGEGELTRLALARRVPVLLVPGPGEAS
ncbi:hypothetical protein [Polymorphum gilvum]|uniref:Universal stress protein n=1 Tax=Polymorphum gilvum (strain LMG 25793 / CGMCC 1.9160 / SL003B-26A1) TaxID=991905 RepID=F2J4A2_POLGS|nr:hypothetical protein [Polymorphum gilvum]ADZ71044.1 hypothetical protein SL003B_2621 [Polymorphum gilvum SL003B-26A1]